MPKYYIHSLEPRGEVGFLIVSTKLNILEAKGSTLAVFLRCYSVLRAVTVMEGNPGKLIGDSLSLDQLESGALS